MKERYLGPYTITKVLPHGTYDLADPSDKSKTLRATGAHLKPYTALSPPHEENVSEKGISKEECSEITGEAFALSPHPKDESSENNLSLSLPNGDELQQYEALAFLSRHRDECPRDTFTILPPHYELLDKDEPSFMNSGIPILPPPMPSLQLLHHAQLPFPATAPLACSTPCITTPSPPPKDFESEGKRAA